MIGRTAGSTVLAGVLCAQSAVQAITVEGERLAGALRGLDAQGRVVLATDAGEVSRPLDELREVVHEAAVPPPLTTAGLVVLWSGQTLRGDVRGVESGGHGTVLALTLPPARGPVMVPQRAIRALRCTDLPRADVDGFDEALRDTTGKDLLFAYVRGDQVRRLSVTVVRFEQAGDDVRVVVEFDGKEQPALSLRRVYGLVLGNGVAPDPQPGARVTAHVAGGSVITGALVGLDADADRCVLRLDEGGAIDLPWGHVARLTVRSDRLLYLSDLEPVSVEQIPALGRTWQWLRDRAPAGPNILLHGETFARGLVLVPRTKLVYDLGGRFDRFEATVGIDDRAADVADAVLRVLGDDRVLFEASHVKRGAPPQQVRISVANVRRLVLEADFGDNLDLGDHCAFAEARVLRDG